MTLAAWLHDLNPFLLQISGNFGLRWYGLSYGAGFVIAWAILQWCSRRGLILLSPQRVTDAMLYCVVGVVLGGRLGYIAFYKPELLITFGPEPPWWGALRVNEGGMSSHGGMIGVIIACCLIARGRRDETGVRRDGVPALHLLDITALACPIGLGLGRVANFINGELLGRIVAGPGEPAPWWAVKFPQELLGELRPDELTPAREAVLARLVPGVTSIDDRAWYAGVKALVDRLQHGSAEAAAILDPVLNSRHPSQLYQAFTDGVVLTLVLWWIWRRPRKPGVIGCWFMMTYGVLRVITEFWRLPDAHLAAQRVLGLSRGQWLSVAMFVVGAVGLVIVQRRPVEPIGGWARRLRFPGLQQEKV
ncbi:MAG: prolipoprotein diacylglyceryl transferase [Phycisphaerales bacterium]|nr:prolipoprotein diacylglyceryl transferase [Phycisphaerales bacterium]